MSRPHWRDSWLNSVVLGLALGLGAVAAQVLLGDQGLRVRTRPAVLAGIVYSALPERRRRADRDPDAW